MRRERRAGSLQRKEDDPGEGARDSWVGAVRRDNDAGPDPAEMLACGVEARIRVTPRNESPKITTSHPTLLDTANCSSKCFSRRAEFKSDEFSSGHGFFILVTYVSPK